MCNKPRIACLRASSKRLCMSPKTSVLLPTELTRTLHLCRTPPSSNVNEGLRLPRWPILSFCPISSPMSYAAFKMVHSPTGVETCASAFLTHSPVGIETEVVFNQDVRSHYSRLHGVNEGPAQVSSLPNLVISKANVLEVYFVRCQEAEEERSNGHAVMPTSVAVGLPGRRGANMDGLSGAWLELACSYRLHGNVESMAVLSHRQDEGRRRRDAIILAFRDAKVTVLEFDDSSNKLRTSSMHCFEGPQWEHLKRGRERFARGPLIRAEPIGRCAGVLVYNCQMVVMKAAQVGYCLEDEEDSVAPHGASICAHVASSYVVNLRNMDMKHVKDFVFLHGYNEPVILALHEIEPTWAGRVAVKRHICSITALSINTTLMQHTIFWSAANLPYDAYKLIAVPSPVEGVLVLCGNTLHYYNQSSWCVLALNEFAAAPEGSPEMPKSKISVELDAAQVSWISHDVALFSTKNGNLLLLHLDYDGRTVHKLELSKSRASVLASCMCMVGNNFFFLGSRLGDSILVQYSLLASGANPGNTSTGKEEFDIESEMPTAKRPRHSLSNSQDAAEELLLYSPEKVDAPQRKTFAFAVRDSLVNIGPLRDFAQGLRQSADTAATGLARQSNYELVTCSGHGKNGNVCVLHQSIRPDLITDVNLPGCTGIWTVYYNPGESNATAHTEESEYHAYLIICLHARTMVLETGETLGEVTEAVGYYTQGPTIVAGNIFGRRRVVQVHAKGVRLLEGAVMMQDVPIVRHVSESRELKEVVIVSASIADPYIMLQLDNGSAQLVVGVVDSSRLDISCPSVLQTSAGVITACSLFVDEAPGFWMQRTSDPLRYNSKRVDQADVYSIICRESGNLEIFELPEWSCIFIVKKFIYGRNILSNYKFSDNRGAASGFEEGTDAEPELQQESLLVVTNVCMETWGKKFGRPFLFAMLSDGTMLCYHAYSFEDVEGSTLDNIMLDDTEVTPTSKNLRFARLPIDWVSGEEQGDLPVTHVGSKFVTFRNVGNVQGLFITGSRPAWLMVCRERIRVHAQYCDGAILAFTPLHNINCSHGLIYATSQGFLKICQLPSLNFDNDWPLQKIPVKNTPHQISFHSDAGFYALIISSTVSLPTLDMISGEQHQSCGGDHYHDNPGGEDSERVLSAEVFEVRIIGPAKAGGLWETKGTLPMHQQENAVTLKVVTIKTVDRDQTRPLLAIGTAYAQGEDTSAKGRIILVSIGGDPTDSSVTFREVYSKEMKGSISAIASLQGNLLLAIGAKIILHTWNGSELTGAAFFDAPLYVVSLNIVKNFVLFGDIHKSVYFLNWKEEGAQLQCLAKDFSSLDCFTSEFLIDGSTLSLLVSDSQKNIQIFSYAPKSMESWKGQKLLPRAEFHLGARVAKFLRLQMLPTGMGNRSNRFAVLFGTLDGGIDYLAPLDELTFRRLQTLQKKLVEVVPHVGGLNPMAFRQFQCDGRAHRPGPDNIVDCELLCHYTMLAVDQQIVVARQIGTTRTLILSNLRDLSLSASFF